MTRTRISAWLRRAEIALFVLGSTFLGWAVSATIERVAFQAGQARAFSEAEIEAAGPSSPLERIAPKTSGDPLLLGRIEISRLGVSAIVREGDDDATLSVAVGHVPGTAKPGDTGNVVLAGHRDTFFRELRNIRRHDTIRISTPGGQAEYRVETTEVVGPRETRVLDPTPEARLTLVTCYPFGFIGPAPKRFIVRASLASR